MKRDVRALRGERLGDRGADAAAPAGDERMLATDGGINARVHREEAFLCRVALELAAGPVRYCRGQCWAV